MIFQEEELMLPILIELFNEKDWEDIAAASDAFGYALVEVDKYVNSETNTKTKKQSGLVLNNKNIKFGSGLLTIQEANLKRYVV